MQGCRSHCSRGEVDCASMLASQCAPFMMLYVQGPAGCQVQHISATTQLCVHVMTPTGTHQPPPAECNSDTPCCPVVLLLCRRMGLLTSTSWTLRSPTTQRASSARPRARRSSRGSSAGLGNWQHDCHSARMMQSSSRPLQQAC